MWIVCYQYVTKTRRLVKPKIVCFVGISLSNRILFLFWKFGPIINFEKLNRGILINCQLWSSSKSITPHFTFKQCSHQGPHWILVLPLRPSVIAGDYAWVNAGNRSQTDSQVSSLASSLTLTFSVNRPLPCNFSCQDIFFVKDMGGGFPACGTGHITGEGCIQWILHPGGWSASMGVLHQGRGLGRPPYEIHGLLRDTVNKRSVRILLECILVVALL